MKNNRQIGISILTILSLSCVSGKDDDSAVEAGVNAERDVLADAKTIVSLGWRDQSDYRAEFDSVVSHIRWFARDPSQSQPSIEELVRMTSGDDMLTQAVFVGMLRAHALTVEDAMLFLKNLLEQATLMTCLGGIGPLDPPCCE